MNPVRSLSGIAAAAAVAFSLALPVAHAAEKIKMTIAATSMNYAPYLVAIERGYFKDEGFDVEIVKAGGGTATPALMSGEVDISTSGASALSAILKGAPLKLVYFPWDRPTYQIWSTKPDIKSLEDLKGKTIGIQTRGDTFEIATRIVLMNRGIDPNAVSFTPLGFGSGRMASISSGSLPAAVISRMDVERLKGTGALKVGHMLVDMYGEVRMPYTGIAVAADAIESDRDRVKRLVRACIKGLAYADAFKEKTVEFVGRYNKNVSAEDLATEYDEVMASKTADGTVPEKFQQQEIELRAAVIGVAKSKLRPLDEIFDFSMADEVNQGLTSAGWKPAS